MSKKRGAAAQITKDDFTKADEEPSEEGQEFKAASEDALKSRKFAQGKRRTGGQNSEVAEVAEGDGPASAGFPTFDFGVPADGVSFAWPEPEKGKDDSKDEKDGASDGGFQWGGGSAPAFNWGSFESSGSAVHDPFAASEESSSASSSSESSIIQPPRPAVEFKPVGQQESGTEKDKTVHKVFAKVFVLRDAREDSKDKSEAGEGEQGGQEEENQEGKDKDKGAKGGKRFVECGQGELHINTYQQDHRKRARMVLRAEKTQRLVLNAPIFKAMSYHVEGEKFLRFLAPSEDGASFESYLLKFKAKEDAGQVKQHIDDVIATLS
jgi:hypothetical protein